MLLLLVGPRIIKAGFKIVAVLSAVFGPESISYKLGPQTKKLLPTFEKLF